MTLGELAERLHVSPASISIVRHGRPGVSEETRHRIQVALELHGFSYVPYNAEPVAPAKNTVSQRRYIRLLKYYRSALLTDKNEGFVDAIISAIDSVARAEDYSLVFTSISSSEFDSYLNDSFPDNCIGQLIIATEMDRRDIEKLKAVTVPTVVLDCDHPAIPFSTVTMDNRDLAYNAVSHLKSFGEVGYLRSRIRTGNFSARGNGYLEALRDFNLPVSDDLLFTVTPSLNEACNDMKHLLEQGRRLPRAFFADNDVIAIGAMRAMQAHGYHLPEDISIIGVDNTMLSQVCMPPLTSFQISCAELGEQAIQLLLHQLMNPSGEYLHMHIGSRLIVRDSTPHLL